MSKNILCSGEIYLSCQIVFPSDGVLFKLNMQQVSNLIFNNFMYTLYVQ